MLAIVDFLPDHPALTPLLTFPARIASGRTVAPVHLGGRGDIAVDPVTHSVPQPHFEVTGALPGDEYANLGHGMTDQVRLHVTAEPLGKGLGRQLARFWNRLLKG